MHELANLGSAFFMLPFVAAGLSKLDGWSMWRSAVAHFVPVRVLKLLIAVAVPLAELMCGVVLLARPRWGLVIAGAMLLAFAGAVLALRGKHSGAPCRCFGAVSETRIGTNLAVRDLVLAAMAAVLAPFASGNPLRVQQVALAVAIGAAALLGHNTYRFVHGAAPTGSRT